jgi:hypothetical protein
VFTCVACSFGVDLTGFFVGAAPSIDASSKAHKTGHGDHTKRRIAIAQNGHRDHLKY